jgi:hypothetical protein
LRASQGVQELMTEPNYEGASFCEFQQKEEARGGLCKWDMRPPVVPWFSTVRDGELGGLSAAGVRGAIEEACSRWEAVCGLSFFEAQSHKHALLVISAGIRGEGPGGTLAWSELPCGPDRQLAQQYDRKERWVIADNAPSNRIDLTRVICHEVGHAIGISHIGSGNLLAPTYSTRINRPQAGDIVEAQARYGRPAEKRKPEPADPPKEKPQGQITLILRPDGLIGWEA